jgi:hypothetical protein
MAASSCYTAGALLCGTRGQRQPTGISDELQIPWQPWFVVMSADGSMMPEYREALRLDE